MSESYPPNVYCLLELIDAAPTGQLRDRDIAQAHLQDALMIALFHELLESSTAKLRHDRPIVGTARHSVEAAKRIADFRDANFANPAYWLTPKGHCELALCREAQKRKEPAPAPIDDKSKKKRPRGRPAITMAQRRNRQELIAEWERFRDSGTGMKKDFCQDKNIKLSEFEKLLAAERVARRRDEHK